MSDGGFWALFAEARSEMANPKTTMTADTGTYSYEYAPLNEVIDIITKPLNDRGIVIYQHTYSPLDLAREAKEAGLEGAANANRYELRTFAAHDSLDEPLLLDATPYEYAEKNQTFGAHETYARRYSLLKACLLAGDRDMDGLAPGEGGTVVDLGPVLELHTAACKVKDPDEVRQALVEVIGDKSMHDYTEQDAKAAQSILSGIVKENTDKVLEKVDKKKGAADEQGQPNG